MRKLLVAISLCAMILSVFSQEKNIYSTSFLQKGFPVNVKNFKRNIDGMMRGVPYTSESSKLETGIDTLTGYFGVIKIDSNPGTLYTVFIANKDSLLSGQLGIKLSKDTLDYLKAEIDLRLSGLSKDKIHLALKYNPKEKTVLYRWGNNGKIEIDVDNVFKVGNEFPLFKIKDLDGNEISIKDIKDKIVVINWWHTGCGPCILEMPGLNELVNEYNNSEDVLFISIANNTKKELEAFLAKREFRYRQGLSTVEAEKVLGNSYPQHIIKGKDGKIAFFTSGGGENRAADIKREIEKLINRTKLDDKLFIEYDGEFNPMNGYISKIEKSDSYTSINIHGKSKDQQMAFKNSAMNESFISYIENGDLLDLKIVNNEKKIAIFKQQNGTVKVRIFYVR